ncbi:ArsR/SmtB family transcription factor [Aurantiacibacter poecillastricola]|uniref:ArsR/SmtB family transcription factor n=1 Tax=Aurantiacibacter poecillastricola TaxID=3064385 RepID=UPI00273F7AFF|nr:metalloregulator ArsR/SmtB family transcription factor [Aurantiacibacter sp. 219JJ12-13]MDP5261119.1 metalloregulator ArsR/SmtB family transcription factor [Aurantiacibacter sp. 219JJ12-13]
MDGLPDRDYDTNAEILYALAHATRLQILCAIKGTQRAVSDIEEMTGITQPRLSQQLAILRKASLVNTQRDGKQVLYSVNQERMSDVADMLDTLAGTTDDGPAAPTKPDPARPEAGGAARFARITR